MKIKNIFEKVNLSFPVEQRHFFNYYEDAVTELITLFGEKFVCADGETFIPPKSLSDNLGVHPLYAPCVVDNILFLSGAGEAYKSEFLRKAHNVYLKYWNDNAKGRRIKRMEW